MRTPERPLLRTGLLLAALLLPGALRADVGGPSTAVRTSLDLLSSYFTDDDVQAHVVRDHVVALASGVAALTFEYGEGGALTLSLDHGEVRAGGRILGRYPEGGALEAAWRALALEAARRDTPGALELLKNFAPSGLSRDEANVAEAFRERAAPLSAPPTSLTAPQLIEPAQAGGLTIDLTNLGNPDRLAPLLRSAATLRGPALRITVPGGEAHAGAYSIGSAERHVGHVLVVRGHADIYGVLEGNIASVEGNIVVHPGAVVTGDVLAVSGEVRDLGGEIRGEIRTLGTPRILEALEPGDREDAQPLSPMMLAARNAAGVGGTLLMLVLVGLGLVLFARQPLEVVSDTALHSFSRSFLVGLLGQVLVLPTFGMLVVGLILSVAGILLVPFAVIVFALLLIVAVLGGFLAVAHAMGESLTRRQLAQGASIANANSYRYVVQGLGGVALLWLVWVGFGWVPVAGTLLLVMASLVTWLLATVGFGASLLSRAGFREHFAGRLLPQEALTDEYLWLTPQFGVTAVKRPPRDKTPPPLG